VVGEGVTGVRLNKHLTFNENISDHAIQMFLNFIVMTTKFFKKELNLFVTDMHEIFLCIYYIIKSMIIKVYEELNKSKEILSKINSKSIMILFLLFIFSTVLISTILNKKAKSYSNYDETLLPHQELNQSNSLTSDEYLNTFIPRGYRPSSIYRNR